MMSKDDLVVGSLYCCKARGSVMLLQGFDSSGDPLLLVQKPGDLIILGSDRRFPLSLDVFLRHFEPSRADAPQTGWDARSLTPRGTLMKWLMRLLGGSANPNTETLRPDAGNGGLAETVQLHLSRLRRDLTDTKMKDILDEVSERSLESALAIEVMVTQTATDGKLHTKAIGGGGAKTWLIVSAVPRSRQGSAEFFASEYPPGYGGYLTFWLNSSAAQTACTMGHSVMAQLLIYADRSVGLGLCSLDMSNPLGACPKWVFPEESMTKEDRRLMGLGA